VKCEGDEVAVCIEKCSLTYVAFPYLILQNALQKVLNTDQKQVKKAT